MVLLALISSRVATGRRLYILWVDLRTAFPSLNRAILIRRLFECGLSVAFCRLALATLDSTVSILCIGRLLGRGFAEKVGVREGAVESPHQFNSYIDGLKTTLEAKHTRLCRMAGFIVALLLYADDAAIPADTPADLQLAAEILEQLCNDHRLFISVPQSFVTVFHAESDVGVRYDDDDKVWIDGAAVNIKIYGIELKAAREFKYLGVYVNEFGNPRAHFSHRAKAFSRAVGAFWAGTAKIPAVSFDFLNYLWRTLVAPVAAYGADVYAWNEEDAEHFLKCQRQAWRRMLQVGGRAPIDIVSSLLPVDCVSITWRAQRMAIFLRLFNSAAGTLQQIAFVALRGLSSPWYEAAAQDLQVLLPDLILDVGGRPKGTVAMPA